MRNIDFYLRRLERWLAFVGGGIIFLLVLLTTANVLGRWIFAAPIDGYVDWVEQAMAFIAFLGLAYTQRLGGHIRMDIVIRRLSPRRLWFAELISGACMWNMCALLLYGSWLHFLRAYQIGDSSLDIELPTWPAKLVVPIALAVLLSRLTLQCVVYARAFYYNQTPIIVEADETATTPH